MPDSAPTVPIARAMGTVGAGEGVANEVLSGARCGNGAMVT